MQKARTLHQRLSTKPAAAKDQQTKKLSLERVPAINTITHKDINTVGSTLIKASLLKKKRAKKENRVWGCRKTKKSNV